MWLRVTGAPPSGRTLRRLLIIISAGSVLASMLLSGAVPAVAVSVDSYSQVTTDAAGPVAVDTSVHVVVTLQDENGPTGQTGQTVTVTVTGEDLTTTSSPTVADQNDGTYTADFSETKAQAYTIAATVNGEQVQDTESVTFTPGPASPLHTLITADAGPFTVDNPRSAGLTVQLMDVYDNPLTTSGGTVVLSTEDANATLSAPSDLNTGAVTSTLTLTDRAPRTISVTGTLDGNPITDTQDVVFLPGALDHFSVDNPGNQVAGASFSVDATAYDFWNNVKTDYDGTQAAAVTGDLATSPACASCGNGGKAFDPGTFGSWTDGEATASGVTAYAAELGTTITVSDGTPSGTSTGFDVSAATVAHVDFEDATTIVPFNGQPITTKKGTPIYSVCVPSGSSTTPCNSGTSTPVQALARDDYGNPVDVALTLTAPTSPGGGLTGTTSGSTGPDGQLAFSGLTVTPATATGSVQLLVTVGVTSITASSNTIQLVDDLEACIGSTCDNLASNSNGNSQSAFAKINGTGPASGGGPTPETVGVLDGVTLVTQFQTSSPNCSGLTTQIGKTTDVHIEAAGGAPTIDYQVALVIPKATLQASGVASRNIAAFNVCFGATYLGSGAATPWKAKTSPTNATLIDAVGPDGGGLYWGWLPDCSAKKNPPTLTPDNPCISLRTKNADQLRAALGMTKAQFAFVGFSSGDLALVYRTKTPWDAKGSIF